VGIGIYKAYDIRGIYPSELDETSAWAAGCALAHLLAHEEGGPVVVGRDMRLSSESLSKALTAGLNCEGREVIDIGLVTTPMLYFAVNILNAAGGVMTTASHNPAIYNGFKLVRHKAVPIGMGSGLEIVRDESENAPYRDWNWPSVAQRTIDADYIRFFSDRFKGPFTRRIVVDCGNGATGSILPQVLDSLGVAHEPLFFEHDGRFPNHEANPLKEENLADLRKKLLSSEGALGVAFDGDGDRVAFLDEAGERVSGDLITALLAQRLLRREGSHPVLYDLRSSRVVPEIIRAAGGTPIRMRVGHAFMKQAMREHEALFGGELSFHYYFRDFFNCESGILAMLEVLRVLEETGESLREAVGPFRTYAQSGEINFKVANVRACIGAVEKTFTDGKRDELDGLTVEYPDWWLNLRSSNTEPLLRLNLEAESAQQLDEKLSLVEEIIKTHPEGGPRE
jgi:phosphomannomutase